MTVTKRLPPPPPPIGHTPPGARVPELQRKLDSMRPGSLAPEPIADEDVTGVMVLAVERVADAQRDSSDALRAATSRLLHETERTRELTRALSRRPPE